MPIEPPISSVSPSPTNGSRRALCSPSATASASSAPMTSGSRMPNSSPPRRATVSAVRRGGFRRSAPSWRSTSPWRWARVAERRVLLGDRLTAAAVDGEQRQEQQRQHGEREVGGDHEHRREAEQQSG